MSLGESSMEMPTIARPWSLYLAARSTSSGVSSWHGPQVVDHMFTSSGLPLNAARLTSWPFMSFNVKLRFAYSTFVGFAWQLAKPTTARPAIASPATSWRHVHRVRLDPILTSVTGHDSAPRAHLWPQHVPCAPGAWDPGRRVVCPPAVTGARPRGSSQAAWRPYRRTTPGRWRSAAGQLPSRARRCPRSYGANGCRSLYMTGCN